MQWRSLDDLDIPQKAEAVRYATTRGWIQVESGNSVCLTAGWLPLTICWGCRVGVGGGFGRPFSSHGVPNSPKPALQHQMSYARRRSYAKSAPSPTRQSSTATPRGRTRINSGGRQRTGPLGGCPSLITRRISRLGLR